MSLEKLSHEQGRPIAKVPGLGDIFYKESSLDVSYSYFRKNDADLMDIANTLYSRLETGKVCRSTEKMLCGNDIFTREGGFYCPDSKTFVMLRKSWILTRGSMPLAMQASKDGEEFFVSKDLLTYLSDSHKSNDHGHFIVEKPGEIKLSKTSDDFLEWAFHDRLEVLRSSYDKGIRQINIIFPKNIKNPKNKDKPFAGQLYSGELYNGNFAIGMAEAILHHDHPTFGLRRYKQTQQL